MVASFFEVLFRVWAMFTQAKEKRFRLPNASMDAGVNFNSPVKEKRVIVTVLYRNLAQGNYSLRSLCQDNRY